MERWKISYHPRNFSQGRGGSEGSHEKEVNVPEAVDNYNRKEGGVNQGNQMMKVSPTEGKQQKFGRRWYFCQLVNMCIFNVWSASGTGRKNECFVVHTGITERITATNHPGLIGTPEKCGS